MTDGSQIMWAASKLIKNTAYNKVSQKLGSVLLQMNMIKRILKQGYNLHK